MINTSQPLLKNGEIKFIVATFVLFAKKKLNTDLSLSKCVKLKFHNKAIVLLMSTNNKER